MPSCLVPAPAQRQMLARNKCYCVFLMLRQKHLILKSAVVFCENEVFSVYTQPIVVFISLCQLFHMLAECPLNSRQRF